MIINQITKAIIFMLICIKVCSAQNFEYSYDNAGNRTSRYVIPALRSQSILKDSIEQYADKISGYDLSIFPNPTREKVNIQIKSFENVRSAKLEVVDINGRLVYSQPIQNAITTIDLSNRLSGNYFLNIIIDGKASRWKVLKTH